MLADSKPTFPTHLDRCVSSSKNDTDSVVSFKSLEIATITTDHATLDLVPFKNLRRLEVYANTTTHVTLNKNVRLSSLRLRAVANANELLNEKKFRNLRNIEVTHSNLSESLDLSGFSYLDKLSLADNDLGAVPHLPSSIIALNMSYNPLQR